jgi:hypothetical protein
MDQSKSQKRMGERSSSILTRTRIHASTFLHWLSELILDLGLGPGPYPGLNLDRREYDSIFLVFG